MVDAALVTIMIIAASKASAIISGVLLSIFWLKEKYVWQYDLTAIIIMIAGSVTMIIQADK
jgi:uncharacterized protein (DUF486 family)